MGKVGFLPGNVVGGQGGLLHNASGHGSCQEAHVRHLPNLLGQADKDRAGDPPIGPPTRGKGRMPPTQATVGHPRGTLVQKSEHPRLEPVKSPSGTPQGQDKIFVSGKSVVADLFP